MTKASTSFRAALVIGAGFIVAALPGVASASSFSRADTGVSETHAVVDSAKSGLATFDRGKGGGFGMGGGR